MNLIIDVPASLAPKDFVRAAAAVNRRSKLFTVLFSIILIAIAIDDKIEQNSAASSILICLAVVLLISLFTSRNHKLSESVTNLVKIDIRDDGLLIQRVSMSVHYVWAHFTDVSADDTLIRLFRDKKLIEALPTKCLDIDQQPEVIAFLHRCINGRVVPITSVDPSKINAR